MSLSVGAAILIPPFWLRVRQRKGGMYIAAKSSDSIS